MGDDAKLSLSPFDKLAGKRILKAGYSPMGDGKCIAHVDFDDGTILTFVFSGGIFLHGEIGPHGPAIFSLTPVA